MKNTRVKYPIVFKMFVVISLTLFISLGIIIFLSYYFIHNDIRNIQETNNRALNNRVVAFVSSSFDVVYTNTLYLIPFLKNADYKIDWKSIGHIAAIRAVNREQYKEYINSSFFTANNSNAAGINHFFNMKGEELKRSFDKAVVVFDASNSFNDLPILVMRIIDSNIMYYVFFYAENISYSFSAGANSSLLLDDVGEPLILSSAYDHINGKLYAARRLFNGFQIRKTNTGEYVSGTKKGFFAIQNINIGDAAVVTLIDQDIVFESIVNTTLRNMYLTLGVWFISIIVIWFFSLGISTPLLKLREMSSRIEEGEYDIKLKITSKDETGLLTATMNDLSNTLGNFEKFTNRTIARLARKEILPIGGENKNATFFFSDIRSFTAISEKLTPTEVISFLNDYMERMVACILATNGAIDKFIGDAVMAHWGAVETSGSIEDDAINGVCSAIMMRASLASFNEGRGITQDKPIIKIGCGLNSGSVVAGIIGTEQKIVYTVIGDAVSFADRCETFNKAFGTEIIISEYTYNLLQDKFIVEEMKTVYENGVPVKTYAVINIKDPTLIQKVVYEYCVTIPKMNMELAKRCIGTEGPQTLSELRKLLNIQSVNLDDVNVDEEEIKYTVSK